MTATIHHLYTSPGHNYFGHHEKPPGEHAIVEHDSLELVAGRGIPGDRFFDFKNDYKGQVTFIDLAVVDAIRAHADRPDLPAAAFRRNVVISGVDLNSLVGQRFELNGILLEGTQECSPCYWMDQACGKPGTEALMRGRGGLRCRILRSGTLKVGPATIGHFADSR
ncbi:MOSC domain-containing protein [Haloferula sargassicola]|uniref:MOSC domain-containing protein n=1 Tax=Haloferula sargassicola TaxID=490096 RepID=A0ABP9UTJ8_9BACT